MTTVALMMTIIIMKVMMVMPVIQFSSMHLLKRSTTAIKRIKVKHCRKCYNKTTDVNEHENKNT
jgi:hypothetical protein